jgi:hypothetical protein
MTLFRARRWHSASKLLSAILFGIYLSSSTFPVVSDARAEEGAATTGNSSGVRHG